VTFVFGKPGIIIFWAYLSVGGFNPNTTLSPLLPFSRCLLLKEHNKENCQSFESTHFSIILDLLVRFLEDDFIMISFFGRGYEHRSIGYSKWVLREWAFFFLGGWREGTREYTNGKIMQNS